MSTDNRTGTTVSAEFFDHLVAALDPAATWPSSGRLAADARLARQLVETDHHISGKECK